MVTLHWTTSERAGTDGIVTLVELVVENSTPMPVRIRVGNRLDGDIWPPRRHGVPEAGWDEGGFEDVVGAGERCSLGYAVATESNPHSPPAEIVWTERAPETEESTVSGTSFHDSDEIFDIEPTAASVVRTLRDARPPADAVPTPYRTELPDAVESWLSAIETRIERNEVDTDTVEERTVVEQTKRQELARRVAADGRALDSLAERISDLRERVEPMRETSAVGRRI